MTMKWLAVQIFAIFSASVQMDERRIVRGFFGDKFFDGHVFCS